MIFDLLMSAVGLKSGRECRRCAESIDPRDGFAMSEGVCRPCAS